MRNITGYEGTGVCAWCGGPFPNRHRRTYCSPVCAETYLFFFHWLEASRAALRRAHHKCQRCGVTEAGMRQPYEYVLEVHHIDPIGDSDSFVRNWNVKNMPHNLRVLCRECHKEVHRLLWQEVMTMRELEDQIKRDPWRIAKSVGQSIFELALK